MQQKRIRVRMAGVAIAAMLPGLLMLGQSSGSQKQSNLELQLKSGLLINGVPESFTFVFVNISGHDLRMPKPSNCHIPTTGTVVLKLTVKPAPPHGIGHGCVGDVGFFKGQPPIRDRVEKRWELLTPGGSLSVTFDRDELFVNDQSPGRYDFWAEYIPPYVSAQEAKALARAGINFPQPRLVSNHLVFVRKSPSQ